MLENRNKKNPAFAGFFLFTSISENSMVTFNTKLILKVFADLYINREGHNMLFKASEKKIFSSLQEFYYVLFYLSLELCGFRSSPILLQSFVNLMLF